MSNIGDISFKLQTFWGLGSTGQALVSNGPNRAPSFQSIGGLGFVTDPLSNDLDQGGFKIAGQSARSTELLDEVGSRTNPVLIWGDDQTGIGSGGDEEFSFISDTTEVCRVDSNRNLSLVNPGSRFAGIGNNKVNINNENPSRTNPNIVPDNARTNAGIGAAINSGEVSIITTVSQIAAGVETGRFDISVVANDTRFLLFDVTAAAMVRVSRDAVDTAGVGFRSLRIPN